MAENKKGFILYADLLQNIDHLTNEEKGVLFNHLLEYVNDMSPLLKDRLLLTAWKPIERQLKRDLKKYEGKKLQWSEAGKRSAEVRKAKKMATESTNVKNVATDLTVNDNVNVNVNVNEIIDKSITYTEKEFLINWNTLRKEHLKKPSFLNRLNVEDKNNIADLIKDYSGEDFRFALIGLFKQNKLPNGNTQMQSNPTHFLKYFNSYLTAYHDRNTELYGKKEITKI